MAWIHVLFLLSIALLANCRTGGFIPPEVSLDVAAAQCLLSQSHTFIAINAYSVYGKVNPNAIASIATAKEAGFNEVDIYFSPCTACEPDVQAREIVEAFKEVEYGKIWLKIGARGWREFRYYNRRYLKAMLDEFTKLGKKVGIVSSKFEWEDPFGKDYTDAAGYSLMYKSLNKDPSFKDFAEFGGWKKPEAKLYDSDKDVCSISMDLIYRE